MKMRIKSKVKQFYFKDYGELLPYSYLLLGMAKTNKIEIYLNLTQFLKLSSVGNLEGISNFCKQHKIKLIIVQGVEE